MGDSPLDFQWVLEQKGYQNSKVSERVQRLVLSLTPTPPPMDNSTDFLIACRDFGGSLKWRENCWCYTRAIPNPTFPFTNSLINGMNELKISVVIFFGYAL